MRRSAVPGDRRCAKIRQVTSESDIGQRKTTQRDAILAVIQQAGGPLAVNEILDRAKNDVPSLGIATVYRNVKLLLETGGIRAVTLSDGQTRYEAAGLGHHHHFHCRVCNQVFDLDICPVSIGRQALPPGFKVEDHELTLHGVCPSCGG